MIDDFELFKVGREWWFQEWDDCVSVESLHA